MWFFFFLLFFFQAEDGIRDYDVTGVQTCALPISYNQALDEVADVLGEELDSDPRDTVEKAYKRYKSKPQR